MSRPFYGEEFSPAPRLMKWAAALAPLLVHRATQQVYAELNGYGGGWTDITNDVTETTMRTSRGFQSASPDDLLAAPGQWSFSLDNSINNSGHVRGWYAMDSASKRTGWDTNIRVKLQCNCNGRSFTRFVGFVEQAQALAGIYENQTVDVLAVGWLNQAETTSVAGLGAAIAKRGDQLVSTLAALVQKQPTSITLALGLQTYPQAFDDLNPESSSVLDGFNSTVLSGFDRLYEGADGGLVFESRRTRQTFAPAAVTLSDVAPAGFPSLAINAVSVVRSRRAQYNGIRVTVHPGSIDAAAVVLYSLPISASNPTFAAMTSITIQCPYVDPSNLAQQCGGFNMLISDGFGGSVIGANGALPTADFQFTTAAGGGGVDMSSSMSVTVVFGANAAAITIVNNDPTRTAYVALLRCRGQGIYKYQTVQASATFATAQNTQGENFFTADCPYNADPFFAQSAAVYIGGQLSQRVSQIEQGISIFVPAEDEASMLVLLGLDISSVISVTETMTGLAAGLYWINSEALEIDERGNITFTYTLAPDVASSRWQLGVVGSGELGIVTELGF